MRVLDAIVYKGTYAVGALYLSLMESSGNTYGPPSHYVLACELKRISKRHECIYIHTYIYIYTCIYVCMYCTCTYIGGLVGRQWVYVYTSHKVGRDRTEHIQGLSHYVTNYLVVGRQAGYWVSVIDKIITIKPDFHVCLYM